MKVGIIGFGSMGKMMAEKFFASGLLEKHCLLLSSRSPEKLRDAKKWAVLCGSNSELATEADIVFLCLRPFDLKGVLEEIRPALKESALIVSLNGSVSFANLEKCLAADASATPSADSDKNNDPKAVNGSASTSRAAFRIAKVIPSVTAEINRSQTLIAYNENITTEDKGNLKRLLSCMGDIIELPEAEMGMGSELVSCMPGFIASIFDVIVKSAEEHTEIPHDQVVRMVLQTMIATGELMIEKDMSFEDVVARVATPGGITEEGTKAVYEQFPKTAQVLFEKTLEKRAATAKKAEAQFE
ncbi:MAG: NAD(P)-binding domain-containing protein [Clostridiales bacterium]|nr:NAD(P)-binding domain-containing protein [Clostridiales bacterium]